MHRFLTPQFQVMGLETERQISRQRSNDCTSVCRSDKLRATGHYWTITLEKQALRSREQSIFNGIF